jgi:hypothetical protein
MKKVLLGVLMIVITAVGIYSCTKQVEVNQTEERSKYDFSNLTLRSFSKSDFDIYGTEHNLWMDYIASASNFSSLTRQNLYNQAATFNSTIFPSSSNTWSDFLVVENYALTLLNMTASNARATLIADSVFESSMGFALEKLFDIINTSRSLADYQTKVTELEDYILTKKTVVYDSTNFEGNAAALILGACAIARHSGNYWSNAENSITSPWYGRINSLPAPNPSSPSLMLRLPRWLRAAAKDVAVFVSSEDCVIDDHPTGIYMYDFVCAWKEAGNGSSQVQ